MEYIKCLNCVAIVVFCNSVWNLYISHSNLKVFNFLQYELNLSLHGMNLVSNFFGFILTLSGHAMGCLFIRLFISKPLVVPAETVRCS